MRFSSFLHDRSGTAVVEFGLLAPVIVGLIAIGVQLWGMNAQVLDMRSAVDAGARYFMAGGSSDTVGQSSAVSAWRHRPGDGVVTVSRYCLCAGAAADCTGLCAAVAGPPSSFVSIKATATWPGWITTRPLAEERSVRVR